MPSASPSDEWPDYDLVFTYGSKRFKYQDIANNGMGKPTGLLITAGWFCRLITIDTDGDIFFQTYLPSREEVFETDTSPTNLPFKVLKYNKKANFSFYYECIKV